jgi:hypothetical protein
MVSGMSPSFSSPISLSSEGVVTSILKLVLVFQLSAQFPGPTAPRDFITMLLTSGAAAVSGSEKDRRRPLRQFVIVSKPCIHPDCPPRQGFIRGQYESVEIIRELPSDKPAIMKRARSSIDLGNDLNTVAENLGREAILRAAQRAASGEDVLRDSTNNLATCGGGEETEETSTTIEWLMVTRSDPGGNVPRFLIEKGTPGGIVNDAGKFLKWVTAKSVEDFSSDTEMGLQSEALQPEREKDAKGSTEIAKEPTANLISNRLPSGREIEQSETVPSSNGLYGMITGAIGYAGSAVVTRLPNPFASSLGSQPSEADMEDEDDGESTLSETSSIHTFTSALEPAKQIEDEISPDSLTLTEAASTQSESSSSRKDLGSIHSTQHEKELKKLHERQRKAQEKMSRLQQRLMSKHTEDKQKDADTLAKARERHERELAKHETKYRRELKRLEDKREQEEKKADERRRKATEREERATMALELEKVRAERDIALKQIEMLKSQVGELQSQNTMLVAQLGKTGRLRAEELPWTKPVTVQQTVSN